MQLIQRYKQSALVLALCLWMLAGCASSPYINIDYRLPAAPLTSQNRTVYLDYKDERAEKEFLSPSAHAQFKYFTGIFGLTLIGPQQKNVVGSFEAASLFKEAFKRRLNALGIEVIPVQSEKHARMEIGLKEFFLNLDERKWKARIHFETRLTGPDGRVASQAVAGAAERFKSVGQSEAEKVLSDIFSDAVNQVNITDLFQKAGL